MRRKTAVTEHRSAGAGTTSAINAPGQAASGSRGGAKRPDTMRNRRPPESSPTQVSHMLHLYREMLLIRRFEERCNALFLQGKIPSTLHLYIGQEAVAVGVSSVLRED